MKRVIGKVFGVMLVIVLVSVVLSACLPFQTGGTNATQNQVPNSEPSREPSSEPSQGQTQNPPIPTKEINFKELLSEHYNDAQNFVRNHIRPNVAQDKTVLAENWAIKANNSDKSLKDFEIIYLNKLDGTMRSIDKAIVSLNTPLDIATLVDGNFDAGDVVSSVSTSHITNFDAKTNTSNLNMSDFSYYKTVYSKNYTAENFSTTDPINPDRPNPPVQEDKINNLDELISDYSDVVYNSLNSNCLETIGRNCLGRTFKTSKVLSTSWDLGNSDVISKIDLIMKYQADSITERYIVCSANLTTPINVKDLNKDNIASTFQNKTNNMTSSQSYSFMYNTSIQAERADLTNAICNKVFGENNNATRYIVDNGVKVDNTLGMEVRQFKVAQITDNGIKETSIRIKNASSDAQFVTNLQNSTNYYTFEQKTYNLSGNKVQENSQVSILSNIMEEDYAM